MANITISGVTKRYGNTYTALRNISLEIADGEFLVLVGPSGCGKSTLLRMVAGLDSISEGEIRVGGKIVNDLQPKDRDIAMIFQTYALFPHMTVERNLGFGLRLRKTPKEEANRRIQEAAKTLGLTPLLGRYPAQLSGGQRQRVAIGRALVRNPVAFLMDEPLANLDTKLRVHMRTEFARLREQLKTTTIYVTHDQTEAMTLGHRVCVMRDGEIQQIDTPNNLFAKPANIFVAGFIGSPEMNFAIAQVDGGNLKIGSLVLPVPADRDLSAFAGKEIIVGIRPTDFRCGDDAAYVPVDVKAELVERLGSENIVVFPVEGRRIRADQFGAHGGAADDSEEIAQRGRNESPFTARIEGSARVEIGQIVRLGIRRDSLHFFDPKTGVALA